MNEHPTSALPRPPAPECPCCRSRGLGLERLYPLSFDLERLLNFSELQESSKLSCLLHRAIVRSERQHAFEVLQSACGTVSAQHTGVETGTDLTSSPTRPSDLARADSVGPAVAVSFRPPTHNNRSPPLHQSSSARSSASCLFLSDFSADLGPHSSLLSRKS